MTRSETMFETVYTRTPRALPIDGPRPLRRLLATLAAGVTALSLMLATAVPAHADRRSDDLAKAVAAAIALGLIVHSIDRGRADPAPVATPVRHRAVPAVCAVEVRGARRDRVVYPERCLRREGFEARLPRDCAVHIRIRGREDRAYGERCLLDAGFRIGGGRDDRRYDRGGRGHGYGRSGY